jgi:hypothetical protein
MVAEDHADSALSAKALYEIIRERMLHTSTENMLPLVYVLDSILKNAKGHYITVVEKDAANWMPVVYKRLPDPQRAKLEKVWRTWNEFKVFNPESWKSMGACFDSRLSDKAIGSSTAKVAGISRTVRRFLSSSSVKVIISPILTSFYLLEGWFIAAANAATVEDARDTRRASNRYSE